MAVARKPPGDRQKTDRLTRSASLGQIRKHRAADRSELEAVAGATAAYIVVVVLLVFFGLKARRDNQQAKALLKRYMGESD